MNGLVVGVSGGLDSAVVAHLIKRAFPDNALGVIMPVKSNPKDREDALRVIESAQIDVLEIDLTNTHELLFNTINEKLKEKDDLNEDLLRLGDANLRTRLRMSTLYTVANNYRYLVCGTDNAAEWHIGYFTKYGDGGVDLNPLVHDTKRQVRELAAFLEVPRAIIEKEPSAGLWEGQTDEDELGTSYEVIDAFLEGKDVPKYERTLIEKKHQQTEHKRQLPATPEKFF